MSNSSGSYYEVGKLLSSETKKLHRTLTSLDEELEAVDCRLG